MRPIPPDAVALIRRYEALRLAPYHDAAGYPTIGWGHLLSKVKWAPLSQWPSITEEAAEALFQRDVQAKAGLWVVALVSVPLADHQYGALTSFVFNVGSGQFRTSTLRMELNRGQYAAAAEQFSRWVHSGGRRLRGLERRRRDERAMFLGLSGAIA